MRTSQKRQARGIAPLSRTRGLAPLSPPRRTDRRWPAQPRRRREPTPSAGSGSAGRRRGPGGEGRRAGAAAGCGRPGRPGRGERSAATAATERRRVGPAVPAPAARASRGLGALLEEARPTAEPVPSRSPPRRHAAPRPQFPVPAARTLGEAPNLGTVRNPRGTAGAGKPRGDPSARPSRRRARPAPAGPRPRTHRLALGGVRPRGRHAHPRPAPGGGGAGRPEPAGQRPRVPGEGGAQAGAGGAQRPARPRAAATARGAGIAGTSKPGALPGSGCSPLPPQSEAAGNQRSPCLRAAGRAVLRVTWRLLPLRDHKNVMGQETNKQAPPPRHRQTTLFTSQSSAERWGRGERRRCRLETGGAEERYVRRSCPIPESGPQAGEAASARRAAAEEGGRHRGRLQSESRAGGREQPAPSFFLLLFISFHSVQEKERDDARGRLVAACLQFLVPVSMQTRCLCQINAVTYPLQDLISSVTEWFLLRRETAVTSCMERQLRALS